MSEGQGRGGLRTNITLLLQKFRDGHALTPKEQEWVLAELARISEQPIPAKSPEPGEDQITDIHDVVSFVMPATVAKGAYELNMVPYQGPCQTEHHVYLMLFRMHQQDVLSYRELFEARGDQEGLSNYITWQAPKIPCTLVRRADKNAEGQCVRCETLKAGGRRAAA